MNLTEIPPGLWIGIALIIGGVVLFALGRRKKNDVSASNGSVAVGRDNSGAIVNINQSGAAARRAGSHSITILAVVIELAGIAVTLWHIVHFSSK